MPTVIMSQNQVQDGNETEGSLLIASVKQDIRNRMEKSEDIGLKEKWDQVLKNGSNLEVGAFLAVQVGTNEKGEMAINLGVAANPRTLMYLSDFIHATAVAMLEEMKFCTCKSCQVRNLIQLMDGENVEVPPEMRQ